MDAIAIIFILLTDVTTIINFTAFIAFCSFFHSLVILFPTWWFSQLIHKVEFNSTVNYVIAVVFWIDRKYVLIFIWKWFDAYSCKGHKKITIKAAACVYPPVCGKFFTYFSFFANKQWLVFLNF